MSDDRAHEGELEAVAVIGLAGRFPGAKDVQGFWTNLRDGVESISFFGKDETAAEGVRPEVLAAPNYVPAHGILDEVELFDAAFFRFSPREAALMDPQHRLFLECAWESLESAGYDPERYPGRIGVYGGASLNSYFLSNVFARDPSVAATSGVLLLSGPDYLPTRVSYKLNLRGPSINVQTSCSTSLVAVHLACQSLVHHECDMALAGGASIRVPQRAGYRYEEGSILSPDGHCRAFDARAGGTVHGNGVGVVVLKRLSDAIADGDNVLAVIRGWAINNDGSDKVGFTAPSVSGQAEVITEALAVSGIDPRTIGYVEAHGTGTRLGDPIEIAALTRAYREYTDEKGYCAIGSVKTNIGHLFAAAGVAGLIKVVLSLHHRQIPPSLHFERPNPEIDFAGSPFYVTSKLAEWQDRGGPRRAGVSSFGLGGTNAHLIVEEAPAPAEAGPSRARQLVCLSAKTAGALDRSTARWIEHLDTTPQLDIADVAYTAAAGRRQMKHRRTVVASSIAELRALLTAGDGERTTRAVASDGPRPVAFMFTGHGAQHVGMARDLYRTEASFRASVDECRELLRPHLGIDIGELLYPREDRAQEAAELLADARFGQPALFTVEHALAKLWMDWGVMPLALIGHSVGEYVAATVAGVFSLADALATVARRAALVHEMPAGAMVSVPLPEREASALAGQGLELALVNGPSFCVLSGSVAAVERLIAELQAAGIEARRLRSPHAFHSSAMDGAVGRLRAHLAGVELGSPKIPFVSNVTGTWIDPERAVDPSYWAEHLRATVRFADGVRTLLEEPGRVLLEVGPGQTLVTFASQQLDRARGDAALATLPRRGASQDDLAALLRACGQLWSLGVDIDWTSFYRDQVRRRVRLPTYPFDRKRHWISPPKPSAAGHAAAEPVEATPEPEQGYHDERDEAGEPIVGPRNEVERAIAGVWRELLGVTAIGVNDDFFELGGHSLMATRVVSRLRQVLGTEVPLRAVFDAPTLAGLAARLAPGQGSARQASTAIAARPPGAEMAVSFGQERLWVLDRLAPGSALYVIPAAVRLRGPLDASILEKGLEEVVRRHQVLRTVFVEREGRPQAQLSSVEDFQRASRAARESRGEAVGAEAGSLAVIDLRALEPERRDAVAREHVRSEARTPFDLAAGPLLRTKLLRLADDEHVLLVTFHHAVADGWSLRVLVRELATFYAAGVRGERAVLPDLPIQYADWAAWQRTWLDGAVLEQQISYWRDRLTGAPDVLALPTDRPRPIASTYRGARWTTRLDAGLARAVAELGRAERATPFMTLLAAFEVLLARYSGQHDIVVGSPIANRTRAEVEPLIGFFANTLVLRTDLSGRPSFRELVGRARDVSLGAYAHQDLPFERLVTELKPTRTLGVPPLVQVVFGFHESDGDRAEPGPLRVEPFAHETPSAHLDLAVMVTRSDDELVVAFDYSTDLFDESTISRMGEHLRAIIRSAVAAPALPIDALQMMGAEERTLVVSTWNATTASEDATPVHASIAQRAARDPARVALVQAGREMRYGELDSLAGALARQLRARGIHRGDVVGVCLERSFSTVVALLGVLHAGAAYLPLDPSYPPERLRFMVEDARPALVLTNARGEATLGAGGPELMAIDLQALAPDASLDRVAGGVTGADLAYVIYTSGSTGRPKGVMVHHRGLTNLVRAQIERFGIDADSRVLQYAALGFDASVSEIFTALCAGATLCLPGPGPAPTGADLAELLDELRITTVTLVPSVLSVLPDLDVPSLAVLVAAGEACSPELVARWLRVADESSGFRLLNAYGPTEFTVCATIGVCTADGRRPTIGTPIDNARVYVLDAEMAPVPVGVPGELCVGGVGVARGYLGRRDLTAEKMVPDPFGPTPGGRLYRTGDLVRWRPDGQLEFIGRVDEQIKLRGHRIELGEIEAALRGCPGLREAAAVLASRGADDARIVAHVVLQQLAQDAPHEGDDPAVERLRAALRSKLPAVMVPSDFVFHERLPRSPSGKIDKKALAELVAPPPARRAPPGAPRDDLERELAAIWATVLGIASVGVGDDFFELGGHSLLTVRLVGEVARATGRRLPLSVLFERATIAHMAEVLRQPAAQSPSVVRLRRGNTGAQLVLIHPAGGQLLCYRDLCRALRRRPIVGIEATEPAGASMAEIASHHVAALRRARVSPPYVVAGWSFGGLLALDVAQRLRAQGDEVRLVIALDTTLPVEGRDLAADDANALSSFLHDLAAGAGKELRLPEGWAPLAGASAGEQAASVARACGLVPPVARGEELIRSQWDVFRANLQAQRGYSASAPASPSARVMVFVTGDATRRAEAERRWRALLGEAVVVRPAVGTHYSMLRPPAVSDLAARLDSALSIADAER